MIVINGKWYDSNILYACEVLFLSMEEK